MITTINEFKNSINEDYKNFDIEIKFLDEIDDNIIETLLSSFGDYNQTEKTLYIWETTDPDMDNVYIILDDNFTEDQYILTTNEESDITNEGRGFTLKEIKFKAIDTLKNFGIKVPTVEEVDGMVTIFKTYINKHNLGVIMESTKNDELV
jgi:hypothetical protein